MTTIDNHPEANFKQSTEFASAQTAIGKKIIVEDFGGLGHAVIIVQNAKRGRYLEIPCGPLIDWQSSSACKKTIQVLTDIAKHEKGVFIRLRPQLTATAKNLKILSNLGLKSAPMPIAPENTVILDLTKSEDELLMNMRRQTRYDIRQAEKKGVIIKKSNSRETFEEFHKIQLETAKRQNFIPPDKTTLLALRESFQNDIIIYTAETPAGEKIAYGLFISSNAETDYYEAASTSLNRKFPGSCAILWQAIKDAKAAGSTRFDLWGIAPENQPNHRYAGVTTFKTGFGGERITFVPTMDLTINKLGYAKNLLVETVRKKRRHL